MIVLTLVLIGCSSKDNAGNAESEDAGQEIRAEQDAEFAARAAEAEQGRNNDSVTAGTEEYEGFLLDNVLHSETEGDIHYNVYIPDSYDGSEPYALYFTLPGYQGLYFQGVGMNVRTEDFGFTAREYKSKHDYCNAAA